jgi:cellulose synthase operon protein C
VRPRYLVAIIAALALGVPGTYLASAQLFQDDGQSLEEARQHFVEGDFRAARWEVVNAIRDNPKSADALILQANIALALFDGTTAQTALERATKLGRPKSNLAHLLGHAMWLQGRLDEANVQLNDPGIPKVNKAYASRILGRVHMDRGDFVAAQQAFDGALQLAPQDSQAWTDLARLRFVAADQKGSIEAVEYALKLDANSIRAIELRGRLMRLQFGVVAALPWFERGLQISPDDIPLLEEYALTLGEAGRYRDMLQQVRKIIALDGGNSKAFYMQAVLAARAGDCELSKRILPRAGSAFNEMAGPTLVDAICEFELGNFNRAIDRFQRLLALQPNNRHVRIMLATAMYRAGDPFDALDTIRLVAGRQDTDSYSLMLAARAFEASDQRKRSVNPLNDASVATIRMAQPLAESMSLAEAADEVRRNPANARSVLPYVRLLLANGDITTALGEATRLQAANPGVVEAHLLVGDVQAASGSYAEALIAYQKAREIAFTEPVMLRVVDAFARTGNENEAAQTLAAYLAFNPGNLTALRLAGYRNLDKRQWITAIALLERVRSRLGYNDSVLLANLARAYSGAGKHDDAIYYAQIAYRITPANPLVTVSYGRVLLKAANRPKAAVELLQKAANMMPDNVEVAADLAKAKNAYRKSAQRQ